LEDTGKLVFTSICTSICDTKILKNTGYTSITDTGRFWKILVIPALQVLEDSGKYWLYQYCKYWKILENTGYTRIADTGPLITDAQTGQKKQYTSTFRNFVTNLPVSAILV
jgi:hypothetical protein